MSQPRNRPSKAPHKAGGVATNMSALAHSIASESQAEGETPGSTGNVELENQFILRLPTEPSKALREALRSGAGNIKERLSIQLEPEKGTSDPRLRKGIVEFDGWNMSAKVVDLPTIIESQKTIDRKTFYKTADISQIVICKEGEPSDEEDNPTLNNGKKYDPNKVDKKYLYRHGICPPLKNCRKRRFRKTMKKKYIEAPEIEKEVRRLFRGDNEAVSVKWELMTQEQLDAEKPIKNPNDKNLPPGAQSVRMVGDDMTYDESELFGALSDSDEDAEGRESGVDTSRGNVSQGRIDVDDSEGDTSFGQHGSSFRGGNDDNSVTQLVQEHSMESQSLDNSEQNSMQMNTGPNPEQEQHSMNSNYSSQNITLGRDAPTSFSRDMFPQHISEQSNESESNDRISQYNDNHGNATGGENAVALRMQQICTEIEELQRQKREVQANIASGASNNAALLQRFRATLSQLEKDIKDREEEQDAFSMFN